MVRVRVEGGSSETAQRRVQQLTERYSDQSEALREVGEYIRGVILQGFEAQGMPDQWKPLSPGYKAWKERIAPGRRILHLTMALKTAAAGLDGENNAGNITRIGKLKAEFGVNARFPVQDHRREWTDLHYALKHQVGIGVHPRPWLQVTQEMIDGANAIVKRWALTQAGRKPR